MGPLSAVRVHRGRPEEGRCAPSRPRPVERSSGPRFLPEDGVGPEGLVAALRPPCPRICTAAAPLPLAASTLRAGSVPGCLRKLRVSRAGRHADADWFARVVLVCRCTRVCTSVVRADADRVSQPAGVCALWARLWLSGAASDFLLDRRSSAAPWVRLPGSGSERVFPVCQQLPAGGSPFAADGSVSCGRDVCCREVRSGVGPVLLQHSFGAGKRRARTVVAGGRRSLPPRGALAEIAYVPPERQCCLCPESLHGLSSVLTAPCRGPCVPPCSRVPRLRARHSAVGLQRPRCPRGLLTEPLYPHRRPVSLRGWDSGGAGIGGSHGSRRWGSARSSTSPGRAVRLARCRCRGAAGI